MKRSLLSALCSSAFITALAVPALAQDVKQEIQKVGMAYESCIAKQDAACVAALYSKDGVQINPGGLVTDLKAAYEENFKNGTIKIEVRPSQIWPINNDLALIQGETDLHKKDGSKLTLFWSSVDVRESGQWKIRMLTVAPKPIPKEASADKK